MINLSVFILQDHQSRAHGMRNSTKPLEPDSIEGSSNRRRADLKYGHEKQIHSPKFSNKRSRHHSPEIYRRNSRSRSREESPRKRGKRKKISN